MQLYRKQVTGRTVGGRGSELKGPRATKGKAKQALRRVTGQSKS